MHNHHGILGRLAREIPFQGSAVPTIVHSLPRMSSLSMSHIMYPQCIRNVPLVPDYHEPLAAIESHYALNRASPQLNRQPQYVALPSLQYTSFMHMYINASRVYSHEHRVCSQ